MKHGRAIGTLAFSLACATAALAQDDSPRFTVGGVLDTRFVRTDLTRSWLDGGQGKARYGTLSGDEAELARLAQAALLLDAELSEVVAAHAQVKVDAEPDHMLRRGRVGLVEAFASYRPELTPAFRLRTRAGLFFPPVSLEHTLRGWNTPYTVTPSAINTWIGEEVRTAGAELALVLRAREHELSVLGAAFGMNDPAGSMLAWRGWGLHDRTSQTADELPFAAQPFFRPGALFGNVAPWVSPVREIDGRLGWYVGGTWHWPSVLEARGLHYDNRGRPDVFDGRQYAWQTEFTNLGLRLELPGPIELLGQHLFGTTGMGRTPEGLRMAEASYHASYGLLTARAGRHRFTVRYDRFEVDEEDRFTLEDPNNEEGEAWTAAYLVQTGERHRLAVEWLRITSDRPARALLGLAPHAEEDVFQASFRVLF